MKLKNISCTQFAGVRDRNISFSDGINVVYGKNESGKSTMANLIARTLFQKAKLDRRSNKEFCDLYFPSSRKGSNLGGDFADGKITFEAKSGAYTLSKEWGIDARCTLATPEGIVRDQAKIDEILKSVLNYGEGVYSDLLLTSQRNTDTALQTLLDASKKTEAKTEITDAVSLAFAESDGISVDAIEQAIQSRIDEISGKHWDIDREAPVRKAGRWSTGLGEILKAYYALENAKAVLDEISRLERDADQAAHDYADRDAEAHSAEEDYNEFNKFASSLILQKERKKAISRTEEELAKIRKVLVDWPQLEQVLAQAQTLQTESENRDILDKYDAAKAIMSEINTLSLATANVSCPTADEIAQVKTSQSSVASLENKLCGMNLTAAIHMLGNNTIEVTSVRTGQKIDVSDEIANISEAVRIAIPGVMEMQLSPANVDAASVETQIKNNRQIVADIFENYQVESLEALEKLAQMIVENSRQLNAANSRLQQLLGTSTFEQLECAAKKLPQENRSKAEIETSIVTLCGKTELSRFITAKETIISGYKSEYDSINDLKAKAFDLDTELNQAVSATEIEDVPTEYVKIADPEAHLSLLQNVCKQKQKLRETALTLKTAAESKLESYKENIADDPAEKAQKAERDFEEQKSLLTHWLHISEVFKTQKESIHDNPMQDIAESFSHYLEIISGGRVSSEFPEADKLAMQVYSDNRPLDYGKLSEGTKETVSLAFRFAVLDHLFPNGGGVIVLDDPLTDMDSKRTSQACELIKECAKRHQVIFLTCREEYLEKLDGNEIRI